MHENKKWTTKVKSRGKSEIIKGKQNVLEDAFQEASSSV